MHFYTSYVLSILTSLCSLDPGNDPGTHLQVAPDRFSKSFVSFQKSYGIYRMNSQALLVSRI